LTRLPSFLCKRPERGWKHEEASERVFDDLLEKHKDIAGDLDENDKQFIKDLIAGRKANAKNR
jgi:hypothetical protein